MKAARFKVQGSEFLEIAGEMGIGSGADAYRPQGARLGREGARGPATRLARAAGSADGGVESRAGGSTWVEG